MEKLSIMYMLLALLIINLSLNLAKEQHFIKDIPAEKELQCPKECQCNNSQVTCLTLADDIENIPADTRYIILEKELACKDVRIQKLLQLAEKGHIKLIGQCRRDDLSKTFLLKDLINLRPTNVDDNPSNSLGLRTRRTNRFLSRYHVYLKDGLTKTDGTVIVRRGSIFQQGTICDYSWNMADADVICRQLGFLSATSTRGTTAHFPRDAAFITALTCNGDEEIIDQCNIARIHPYRRCWKPQGPASVQCQLENHDYTILKNSPVDCNFNHGFCGWTNSGNWIWSWHGGKGHSGYLTSDTPFIFIHKSPKEIYLLQGILSSPVLKATSTDNSIYITYSVARSFRFEASIELRSRYVGENAYTLIQSSMSHADRVWRSYTTKSIQVDNKFRIEIHSAMARYASSSYGSFGLRTMQIHGASLGESDNGIPPTLIVTVALVCLIPVVVMIGFYLRRRKFIHNRFNSSLPGTDNMVHHLTVSAEPPPNYEDIVAVSLPPPAASDSTSPRA